MKLVTFTFYNLLFLRVQFHLEEGGDLIWKVPPALEQESLPFFSCETFVVSVIVIYVLVDRNLLPLYSKFNKPASKLCQQNGQLPLYVFKVSLRKF